MATTHYEVLGVPASSTAAEIRSAYRKLVLLHHPDRSTDPKSKAFFLAATAAYDVLGNETRRKDYDARLAVEGKLGARRGPSAPRTNTPPRPHQTPSARLAEIKLDVNRLNTLFSRGNYIEAERLAKSILDRDRRQPIPYAVLGDLERMGGNKKEALKLYAYAVQFDPRNPVYQQRYDELVERQTPTAQVVPSAVRLRQEQVQKQGQMFAPLFGLGLILIACTYIVFARETAIFPSLKLISTWTLGLIAMLFFSGVVLGSCMALDSLLDDFSSMGTTALGKISPAVALATIAIVNFWAALAMYIFIGIKWKAFNNSTSRIVASVVAGTCLLAFASEASGSISGIQVFQWGGNLVYLGALSGWMVTDALRSSGG